MSPGNLRCCRLLLRHGVVERFSDILEVIDELKYAPKRQPDFYSEIFLRLIFLAGVNFSTWLWLRHDSENSVCRWSAVPEQDRLAAE